MKIPKDAYRGNMDELPEGGISCGGFQLASNFVTAHTGAVMALTREQEAWLTTQFK